MSTGGQSARWGRKHHFPVRHGTFRLGYPFRDTGSRTIAGSVTRVPSAIGNTSGERLGSLSPRLRVSVDTRVADVLASGQTPEGARVTQENHKCGCQQEICKQVCLGVACYTRLDAPPPRRVHAGVLLGSRAVCSGSMISTIHVADCGVRLVLRTPRNGTKLRVIGRGGNGV